MLYILLLFSPLISSNPPTLSPIALETLAGPAGYGAFISPSQGRNHLGKHQTANPLLTHDSIQRQRAGFLSSYSFLAPATGLITIPSSV